MDELAQLKINEIYAMIANIVEQIEFITSELGDIEMLIETKKARNNATLNTKELQ